MKEVYIHKKNNIVGKRFFLVPGYDGYVISDDGEVRKHNVESNLTGGIVPSKFAKNKDMKKWHRYPTSYLCGYMLEKDGQKEYVPIPQVINLAFCDGVADVIYVSGDRYYKDTPSRKQKRNYVNRVYNIKNCYALSWNEYCEVLIEKCGEREKSFNLADKKITLPKQYFTPNTIRRKYWGMKTRCTNLNVLFNQSEYLGASVNSDIASFDDFEPEIISLYDEYRDYLESGAISTKDLTLDKDLTQHNMCQREYSKNTITLLPKEINDIYRNKISNLPYSIQITSTGMYEIPTERTEKLKMVRCATYKEALETGRKNRATQLRTIANNYCGKIPERIIEKILSDADVVEAGNDKEYEKCLSGKVTIKNFKLARFLAEHNVTPINIRDKRYKLFDGIRVPKNVYSAAVKCAKEHDYKDVSDWIASLIVKETGVEPETYPAAKEKDIVVDFVNMDTEHICNLIEEWRASQNPA